MCTDKNYFLYSQRSTVADGGVSEFKTYVQEVRLEPGSTLTLKFVIVGSLVQQSCAVHDRFVTAGGNVACLSSCGARTF